MNAKPWTILTALLALAQSAQEATALGTAFSYQGSLTDNGNAATGNYDMQFYLRDAASGGNPVGVTNAVAPVKVTNGLFTVLLDFGPGIFDGNNLWLEIGVRTNGSVSPYSTLSPRQPLTPSPYAIMANSASNLLGTAGSATNFSGSLSGDVTGTQSATVVSLVGGQSAGNVASGVIAANAATSANAPNTIVMRDGFGNFSAGTINLSGTLNLPVTSATAGIITLGGSRILHAFGVRNFFAGSLAGNLTMTGSDNTGLGVVALNSNDSGNENTAVGRNALASNISGSDNTASGFGVLVDNTSGSANTADGANALFRNTSGSWNTAIGFGALESNTNGYDNTAVGQLALASNTSGNDNTAIGLQALVANTTGGGNTASGFQALDANTTGFGNTASGDQALWANLTGGGNTASGTYALLANTNGNNNVANGYQALYNNTSGQQNTANGYNALYSQTTGNNNTADGAEALFYNTSGQFNIALGAQAGRNSTNGSFNIEIGNQGLDTDSNLIRIGQGQTNTFISGVFGAAVASSSPVFVTSAGQLGTGGTVPTSAIADGSIGNAKLANSSITISAGTGLSGGGTVSLGGSTTLTNSGILSVTGNPDITASTVNGAVTLGDTATSANSGSAIVKRDAGGSFSAGSVTLSGNLNLPVTSATAGVITSGGSTLVHAFGVGNFFAGTSAGNLTLGGSNNAASGFHALTANTSGSQNTALGELTLAFNTNGSHNTAAGASALVSNTSGSDNTGVGLSALLNNHAGNRNVAVGSSALAGPGDYFNNIGIGYNAGAALAANNSNDIFIASQGFAGDNNTIRIGTQGTHSNTFVAGIFGATSSGGTAVFINSFGQLGTTTSSACFKRDIHDMENASDVLLALRPVTFHYKPELDPNGTPQFGLVAEEVDKVDPDLVVRDGEHSIYSVRYEAVNAMLLNEFLKQHRKVEELEKKLGELQAAIKALQEKE